MLELLDKYFDKNGPKPVSAMTVPRRGTMRPNIVGRHSHLRNNPTRIDHLLEDEKEENDADEASVSLVKR